MGIMQTIVILKRSLHSSGLNIKEQFSVGIVVNRVTMLMIVGNFNLQMNILEIIAQVPINMRNKP